jgi:hypothetical protein
MRYAIMLFLLALGCSTTPRPPFFKAPGISTRATDACNQLIDQELNGLDLTAKEATCAKAIAYKKCGAIMLNFVLQIDMERKAEDTLGAPIDWGKEWCAVDFEKTAEDMVDKHCKGFAGDPLPFEVARAIIHDIMEQVRVMGTGTLN